MNRLLTLVGSTVVAGVVCWTPPAQAQSGVPRTVPEEQLRPLARVLSGTIEGVVLDDRGRPLAGAMVSALGSTSALAVTDRSGTFVLRAMPVGSYLVRAHLAGFSPSRRQFVEVRGASAARFSLTLQKPSDPSLAKTASNTPRVLAAGLAPGLDFDPFLLDPTTNDSKGTSDDQSERAWRLRHLPRSVLKDTTDRAGLDKARGDESAAAALGRALGSSARLFGDLPFSGQVNVLTSSSLDAATLAPFSDIGMRGTANFILGGPAWNHGDWTARVMTQADVGSWFLAAAYGKRAPSDHVYSVGFSYSTQHLTTTSTTRWPIPKTEVFGRAAGSIYGVGRWVMSPRLSLEYGARYSRYDYLGGAGLLSPSISLTLVPIKNLRVYTGISRRMLAPGAEEFLEPLTPGMWVPPERTFVSLTPIAAERTTNYEFGVERDLTSRIAVGFKTFYQDTTDQQVAVFGGDLLGAAESQHYGVGTVGDVVSRGWSVGVTHRLLSRLQGSVAYQVVSAQWMAGGGDGALLLGFDPERRERLHGLMTSMETDLPMTATHVLFACKINSGFVRRDADASRTGLDSRFDVQVTQPLRFLDFTSAQWQVLVAVKNIFRDPAAKDSSIYDELLVLRPPTRIMGGVLVRF
jgi:hypothetical protein